MEDHQRVTGLGVLREAERQQHVSAEIDRPTAELAQQLALDADVLDPLGIPRRLDGRDDAVERQADRLAGGGVEVDPHRLREEVAGCEVPVLSLAAVLGELDYVSVGAAEAAGKTTITIQGDRGVTQTGATQQELGPITIASQLLNFGLDRELKLAANAGTFTVADPVEVQGRAMNVLTRTLQGGVRERFYFDAADGLLRRRELLRPLLLGDDLIQVDFDDFRTVGGVRVPFTIKTSYLDDNHQHGSVLVDSAQRAGRLTQHKANDQLSEGSGGAN